MSYYVSGLSLCVVTDWDADLDANSPAEELYRKLTHDAIRGDNMLD